jgi:hypothetical protein
MAIPLASSSETSTALRLNSIFIVSAYCAACAELVNHFVKIAKSFIFVAYLQRDHASFHFHPRL